MKRGLLVFLISLSLLISSVFLYHFLSRKMNPEGLCRDEEILSQLSQDESAVDFVFLGQYYRLPCPLSVFMENGFEPADEENRRIYEETLLEEGQWQAFRLDFGAASSLGLTVYQSEQGSIPLKDAPVISVSLQVALQDRDTMDPNCFVTKQGLTGRSSRQAIRNVLREDALYREKVVYHYLNPTHPGYMSTAVRDEFPIEPLLSITHGDKNPSGWNGIRLSCFGYGFSGISESFSTGFGSLVYKNDRPVCVFRSIGHTQELFDKKSLDAYVKELSGWIHYTIEDLKTTTLPDDPDFNRTDLRAIYLVTEDSGLAYHIFEKRNADTVVKEDAKDFSYADLLLNDRYQKQLRFLFEQYEGEKAHLSLADKSGKHLNTGVLAAYTNREDLMETADELTDLFLYLNAEGKDNYSYYIVFDDPFVENQGYRLIDLADIKESGRDPETIRDNCLKAYLRFCLQYRREERYSEFSEEEIAAEKAAAIKEAYFSALAPLEGIYCAPHNGLSISAVYELAEKLGYAPEGTPDHFSFSGKNKAGKAVHVEMSYDFVETSDASRSRAEGYYLVNGEKQTYMMNDFCLGTGDLADFFPEILNALNQ